MTPLKRTPFVGALTVLLSYLAMATPLHAEEHIIEAQATKFSPLYIFVEPGDTVTWTNMTGHDSSAEQNLIPEGAEPWNIAMGKNGSVKLDVEGVYLYKCTPHFSLGMAGAIVVGKPANLDAVKKEAKGMYKRVVAKLMKADWPVDLEVTGR